MIITLFPFKLNGLGHEVAADLVVDVGFVRLTELIASRYPEHLPVLDETGTCLMEAEGNILGHALLSKGEYPVVVAWPGVNPGLSPYRYLIYCLIEVWSQIQGREKWRSNYAFMLYRQGTEYGQAVIRHLLIFHRASHDDIVVPVAPVFGHTIHEAVYTLGKKEEPKVAAHLHHLPAFRSPRIGILQQEIRGETGEYDFATINFPRLVALAPDGQIEVAGLAALAARNLAAVHLVLTVNIAILATGAYLGATMPRIPICIYFPVL